MWPKGKKRSPTRAGNLWRVKLLYSAGDASCISQEAIQCMVLVSKDLKHKSICLSVTVQFV